MIELKPQTLALLDEIESRIDPEIEDDFRRQWSDFLHHRFTGDIFSPSAAKKRFVSAPPGRTHQRDAGRFGGHALRAAFECFRTRWKATTKT